MTNLSESILSFSATFPPFSRERTVYVPSSSLSAFSSARTTLASAATKRQPATANRFMAIPLVVCVGGEPQVKPGTSLRAIPPRSETAKQKQDRGSRRSFQTEARRGGEERRRHLSFFLRVMIITLESFEVLNSFGRSSGLAPSTAQMVRVSPSSLKIP